MGTFRFKQFNIRQDNTAMKIGTDGTLLGAWVNVDGAKEILDIGTGTGVIGLMTAQRNPEAKITAIEINEDAMVDALFNVTESPWKDRVNLIHTALQNYNPPTKLDVIVSNPPFFEKSLKSISNNRNSARHTDSLHYTDILAFSQSRLAENGILALILPVENAEKCIEVASDFGLYLKRKCWVKPVPHKPAHRIVFELTNTKLENVEEKELIVETGKRHDYSEDYVALTNAFYIIM